MPARKPRPRSTTSTKATTATPAPTGARTRKTTKPPAAASSAKSPAKVTKPAPKPVANSGGYVGFSPGTASEAAAVALARGGASRTAIMADLRAADEAVNGDTGLSHSWSVALSNVLRQMLQAGWREEGTYRLVPPDGADVSLPEDEDTVYMPKYDVNAPRRGRRRGVPNATAPKSARTRPAKAKTAPVEEPVAAKAAPAKRRGRPRKKAA